MTEEWLRKFRKTAQLIKIIKLINRYIINFNSRKTSANAWIFEFRLLSFNIPVQLLI